SPKKHIMATELSNLQSKLKELLAAQCPPLQIRKNDEKVFEVAGTKPAMQGKQKVDGYYFASIMPKPKDVRFYFFPIYTHADTFTLSADLQKMLKGKSCFHLKKIDTPLLAEITDMIKTGVELYKKDGLI